MDITPDSPVAVLGGGSFGSAMAKVLGDNGVPCRMWVRDADQAAEIQRTRMNARYMPDIRFADCVDVSTDLMTTVSRAPIVIIALPSKAFYSVMSSCAPVIRKDQILISTTKGIESGFRLMSEVLAEMLPQALIGILSGPNLAAEIFSQQLTATVIASPHEQVRDAAQTVLGGRYFRVYANTDVYGVELGGALKNIYAMVAGLASALGMGENTKAMLITRSLAEMSRFACSLGANPMTFLGLSGVGDLIVTCTSPKSRNYRVGYALGQGKTIDDAVNSLGQVAEGINTLKLVREKAQELDIYMPLVNGLYEIIHGDSDINEVIKSFMTAQQSTDVEFVLPRKEEI